MKKYSILLLLGLAFMASSAFADSKKIYCDKKRPDASKCFGTGATYAPTCGYYEKDCPLGTCGKPVSNGCEACSDPNVIYYIKQDCKPEEVVQSCSNGPCNLDADPEQGKVYEPVCGFRKGCTHGDCTTTFDNVCQACKNSKYPWYQTGVCADDRNSCTDKKAVQKASKTAAVCAFFDTADGGVDQHTTVDNAKDACTDSAVKFYTTEECPGLSRGNSTYCLPHSRPDICTLEYNPVCGFYLDKSGALQHKVMPSPCSACADSSIIYHQPGPCVFQCNRNPNIIFECDGSAVDPVCGSYKVHGKTKQISLKNACVGCYGISTKIDTYTDGLCPGDVGIKCANDAGGLLMGYISPVCGLTSEGCKRSSCRQTYAESVAACSQSNVVLFQPGMCPGDEGISCNLYRSKPKDSTSILNDLIYQNVCGYTKKGCTRSSCRKVYSDQYEACGHKSVKFFTEGPC